MRRYMAVAGILLTATLLGAKDAETVLKSARRMCINDSVPQALALLEEEVKEGYKDADEFLLQLEKADILLFYAGLPDKAYKVYTMLTKPEPSERMAPRVYFYLGAALERNEEFRRAARSYEKVITEYSDSPYYEAALSAIERCFLKNYQMKIAEVDGYPITELEVEEIASNKLSPAEREHASTPEGRKELVDRVIYERLLKLAARQNYASAESTEVLLKLNCSSCRPKHVLIPDPLNDADLIEQINKATRGILLKQLYQQEVLDRIEITEKDMKRFYKEHPERFTRYAQYTLREIVTDSITLDSVLAALDAGIPFDSTAKLYSTAATGTRGGILNPRTMHSMPDNLQAVIKDLKVGSTSDAFGTDRGWELLYLESMTEETRTPYEQAEPSLKELVEREMVGKLSEEALQGFKDNADVDTTAAADTLARVAGKVILKADLDAHISKMPLRTPGQEPDSTERKKITDYLVGEMVFDHELAQQKLFLNDNLANIVESKRRQFMVDFYLRQEVDAKAEPGTEDIEAYYKEHKKDFWRPAQVKVREIMLTSADTAKIIYKLLQEGVRFDSLAKIYSQAETGSRSGYVGYIKKDQSEKPYEKQAFKLKEGKFSKPIKIDDYYWLIKVEKHNEGYQRDEQEAHSSIRSILYQENKKALENELENRLVSSAEIVYFTDETAPQPDGATEETPSPGDE